VLVERGARVVGDLLAPRIGIADGAVVRGHVKTEGQAAPTTEQRALPATSAHTGVERVSPEAAASDTLPRVVASKAAAPSPERVAERRPPAPVVPLLSKRARGRKKPRAH
jgi:hypothetical protein